eukprot:UN23832
MSPPTDEHYVEQIDEYSILWLFLQCLLIIYALCSLAQICQRYILNLVQKSQQVKLDVKRVVLSIKKAYELQRIQQENDALNLLENLTIRLKIWNILSYILSETFFPNAVLQKFYECYGCILVACCQYQSALKQYDELCSLIRQSLAPLESKNIDMAIVGLLKSDVLKLTQTPSNLKLANLELQKSIDCFINHNCDHLATQAYKQKALISRLQDNWSDVSDSLKKCIQIGKTFLSFGDLSITYREWGESVEMLADEKSGSPDERHKLIENCIKHYEMSLKYEDHR